MIKDLCFEIIQKCLNNCRFCSSNSDEYSSNFIEYIDFENTILYLHEKFGIEEISLSGGEPFLHPDLLEMVMLCKNLGIKTTIYTSGLVYSKKMSDQMYKTRLRFLNLKYNDMDLNDASVRRAYSNEKKFLDKEYNNRFSSLDVNLLSHLKWCGLDKIVFDFQSLDSDVLSYIMGQDEIKNYLSTSIISASNLKIDIDNHFIPTKINYKEISDVIEILNIYEGASISILNFVPQGRGLINKDELLLSESESFEFKKILNDSMKKYPDVFVRLGIPMLSEDTHLCTAGLSKLTIRYDGVILPCPFFKEFNFDELKLSGFNVLSIYDEISSLEISDVTRDVPLCKVKKIN